MARLTIAQAGNVNRLAFLDMIAACEIDAATREDPRADSGYSILVGSSPTHLLTFKSYAKHPHVLNAALDSTAAGRYQIIYPTWAELQADFGFPDFSPVNQDRAALALIKRRGGALTLLDTGRTELAIEKLVDEWASLPGGSSGQPHRTLQFCINAYHTALVQYSRLPDFTNVSAGVGSTAPFLRDPSP